MVKLHIITWAEWSISARIQTPALRCPARLRPTRATVTQGMLASRVTQNHASPVISTNTNLPRAVFIVMTVPPTVARTRRAVCPSQTASATLATRVSWTMRQIIHPVAQTVCSVPVASSRVRGARKAARTAEKIHIHFMRVVQHALTAPRT